MSQQSVSERADTPPPGGVSPKVAVVGSGGVGLGSSELPMRRRSGSNASLRSLGSPAGGLRTMSTTMGLTLDPVRWECHARYHGSVIYASEGDIQRGVLELINSPLAEWSMALVQLANVHYLQFLPHPGDGEKFPPPPPSAGSGPRGVVPEAVGPTGGGGSVRGGAIGSRGASRRLMVGHGGGMITDARTGRRLYDGEFLWGLRHGSGKAFIYDYRPVRAGAGGAPVMDEMGDGLSLAGPRALNSDPGASAAAFHFGLLSTKAHGPPVSSIPPAIMSFASPLSRAGRKTTVGSGAGSEKVLPRSTLRSQVPGGTGATGSGGSVGEGGGSTDMKVTTQLFGEASSTSTASAALAGATRRRSHSGAPEASFSRSAMLFHSSSATHRPMTPPPVTHRGYRGSLRAEHSTPTRKSSGAGGTGDAELGGGEEVEEVEEEEDDNVVWDAGAASWELIGVYEGMWRAGKREGRGQMKFASGDTYDGTWSDDLPHGRGTLRFASGGTLFSRWNRGAPNGMAVLLWPWGSCEARLYRGGRSVAHRSLSKAQAKSGAVRIVGDEALADFDGDGFPWSPILSPTSSSRSSRGEEADHDDGGVADDEAEMLGGARKHSHHHPHHTHSHSHSHSHSHPHPAPHPHSHFHLPHPHLSPTTTPLSPPFHPHHPGFGDALPPIHAPTPPTRGEGVERQFGRDMAEVRRLLRSTAVGDVGGGRVRGDQVIVAQITDTVEKCLETLSSHAILSLPVFDSKKSRFVGIVHLLDICATMVDLFGKKRPSLDSGGGHLRERLAHQHRFVSQSVMEVLKRVSRGSGESGEHGFATASQTATGAGVGASAVASASAPSVLSSSAAIGTTSGGGGEGGGKSAPGRMPGSTVGGGSRSESGILGGGGVIDVTASTTSSPPSKFPSSTDSSIGELAILEETEGSGSASSSDAEDSDRRETPSVSRIKESSLSTPVSRRESGAESGYERESSSAASPFRTPDPDRVAVAFRPVPSGVGLDFAARVLADGVHAVPIVAADGTLERMVTQADVIRFLAAHVDHLGPIGDKTIAELGIGLRAGSGMVVAHFSDTTIDVMRMMREAGSTAAPIVNQYGTLAANLSLSDLKQVAKSANLSALRLPILQFFRELERGANTMSPRICCRLDDTLSKIILTLAATKVHQLYFVDDSVRPVGCIRVVDILRLLAQE